MIKQPTSDTKLLEFYRQLVAGVPLVNGKELVIQTAGSFLEQKFPHGLGRAYRGAFVMRSTGASFLVAMDPTTVTDADVNITVMDGTGTAATTALWVW